MKVNPKFELAFASGGSKFLDIGGLLVLRCEKQGNSTNDKASFVEQDASLITPFHLSQSKDV